MDLHELQQEVAALHAQNQQLQMALQAQQQVHQQAQQHADQPQPAVVQGPQPAPPLADVAHLARLIKPTTYSGTRNATDLNTWLFQLGQYFEVTHVMNDAQRIQVAGLLMTGQAADWFRDMHQHIHAYDEPLTWATFEQSMRAVFQPLGREITARDKLHVAVQRNKDTLSHYTSYMRSLFLAIPNISEDEKLDRYVRGLQPYLQREVRPRRPPTFDVAVEIAMSYDSLRSSMRNSYQFHSYTGRSQSTSHAQQSGGDDMEIDAIQHEDRNNQRKKDRPQCYNCLKYGHFAKDCRSPRHPDADKRFGKKSGNGRSGQSPPNKQ
jgi:hypothetical protein